MILVVNVVKMKTFLLIAGLILARELPAQHAPPDSTTVAKKEIQRQNRHNAIHASAIVLVFVLYMYFFIRYETR